MVTNWSDININIKQTQQKIQFKHGMGECSQRPRIYFDGSYNFGGPSNSHGGWINAPNGCMYSIPADDTSVVKFNPMTGSYSKFGTLSSTSDKYWGSALSSITGKIYLTPYTLTHFAKIDPITDTYTEISFGSSVGGFYTSMVEANNGMMYCLNRDTGDQVMEFNPITETWRLVGLAFTANDGWCKGILLPSGKILGIPYNYPANFGLFDPSTFHMDIVASSVTDRSGSLPKYYDAVLVDDKVFCIPYYNDIIEVIDINTFKVTVIDKNEVINNGWLAGSLGPNGNIYCPPSAGDYVLEIVPKQMTYNVLPIENLPTFPFNGSARYRGCMLSQNNKIYSTPRSNYYNLVVDFGGNDMNIDTTLHRTINHR